MSHVEEFNALLIIYYHCAFVLYVRCISGTKTFHCSTNMICFLFDNLLKHISLQNLVSRCLVISMLLSFIDHIVCHFVCLQAPELLSMLFDLGKDHRLTIIYERSLF